MFSFWCLLRFAVPYSFVSSYLFHLKSRHPSPFCYVHFSFASLYIYRPWHDFLGFHSLSTTLRWIFVILVLHTSARLMVAVYCMVVRVLVVAGCLTCRGCHHHKFYCGAWNQTSSWDRNRNESTEGREVSIFQARGVPVKSYFRLSNLTSGGTTPENEWVNW